MLVLLTCQKGDRLGMSYRPQFAYALEPEGFQDEDFVYVFTPSNTPGLGSTLQLGEVLLDISLLLEPGSEYRIRSIEVIDPQGIAGFRFRDAFGVQTSEVGAFVPSGAFTASGQSVPLEWEEHCLPGSALTVDLANIG